MKIQTEKLKNFQAVAVVGEVNDDNAMELKHAVQALIEAGEIKILLDFSKVSFATSFAIGVIVHLWKTVGEKGGSLFLLGRSVFRRDLENLNLHRLVRMFSSRAEFLEAVESGIRVPLQIQIRREGAFTVVRLKKPSGALFDLEALSREVQGLGQEKTVRIALDLSELEYLNSEMIALFASLPPKLAGSAGGLTLMGLSEDHLQSLQQTGLHALIRMVKKGDPLPPA